VLKQVEALNFVLDLGALRDAGSQWRNRLLEEMVAGFAVGRESERRKLTPAS
jgi:hypothetical protein